MAISNKIENFQMIVNQAFVDKANALTPELLETTVIPSPDHTGPMGKRDRVVLDFQDHQVGYLSFRIESEGSPADAPAKLRLRFAELPFELEENWESYGGDVSSSWLQEEILFVDEFPGEVNLPRRYAFRYAELTVLDTSPKYRVVFRDIRCRSVSSGDYGKVKDVIIDDPELAALDRVSLRTMHQCMQTVFEDGPKRDRRLWVGDLRLQALGNYATFQNNDLVKRCLYLLAGLTQNEGRVGACLFEKPQPHVDDTALFDYSLFYVSVLHDYYEATHDRLTLEELFPTAHRQITLALRELDEHHVVRDRPGWWCFLDWGDGLNKQAGAQAILIYTMRQGREMAAWLGRDALAEEYDREIEAACKGALEVLWDEKRGFFVSGEERQVSWASQIWFVLADVLSREENARLLERLEEENPALRMVTPYMYHHYVEALLHCGRKAQAVRCLKRYWGEMIRDGADTFFELYDPQNKEASPYGGRIINSFCHAWSGTPAYFIRKLYNLKPIRD